MRTRGPAGSGPTVSDTEAVPVVLDGEETDFPAPEVAFAPRRIREPQWDYVRFVATAAVVLIHVIAFAFGANAGHVPRYLLPHYADLTALSKALRWSVPCFALLTGVLVWGRRWAGGPGAYRDFLARRAKVVALPYLFWVVVYYLLRPSLQNQPWPSGGPVAVLLDFVAKAVDGTVWFHLYFVPVVLVLYLATPLASRAARRSPEALALGLLAFSVVWSVFLSRAVLPGTPWGNLLNNAINYAPYAALGALVAVRGETARRILTWTWPLLIAFGIWGLWRRGAHDLIYSGSFLRVALGTLVMVCAVLGVLGLCWLVSGRWNRADRAMESLYPASFGVYLVHPLVIAAIGAAALAVVPAKELLFTRDLVLLWVATMALSWAATWLLLKNRMTRWLV